MTGETVPMEYLTRLFPPGNRSFVVTMFGYRDTAYFEGCVECGALVSGTHTMRHARWHLDQEERK